MFDARNFVSEPVAGIGPRALVRSNYGLLVIVLRQAPRPSREWLDVQDDRRVRGLPDDERWWEAIPLDGGGVVVPESLSEIVRTATRADAETAYRNANFYGRDELRDLFFFGVVAPRERRSN
jgi:hypothetical protein